ncbi:MAG: hypothetical protein ACJ8EV_03695 [Sphingomicrobium sp.]
MRCSPAVLALVAGLGGCASPAERDLEAVKSARSVLAEWALVEAQASRDSTPATYAEEMRSAAGDQLAKARQTLRERRPEAAARLSISADGPANPAELRAVREALKPLETALADS